MSLSAPAQAAIDYLSAPGGEPDKVYAVVIPHGTPHRQQLVDEHQAVGDELRAAGWSIETGRNAVDTGEALWIGLKPGAAQT